MTITITFGWWLVPLFASILIYAVTYLLRSKYGPSFFLDFTPVVNLAKFGVATILVLAIWLIYAFTN